MDCGHKQIRCNINMCLYWYPAKSRHIIEALSNWNTLMVCETWILYVPSVQNTKITLLWTGMSPTTFSICHFTVGTRF